MRDSSGEMCGAYVWGESSCEGGVLCATRICVGGVL